MFLRGIRRGSSELKVVAVLLNAFGLSLFSRGKISKFFKILSEPSSLEVECKVIDVEGFWKRSSTLTHSHVNTQSSPLMRA
jgi:hypothetical protein